MSPIVEVLNVSKSYRRGDRVVPVLEEINLEVREGEFLALMGPSGSGKSTLLNLIAGLDHADGGTITVGGVDITSLSESDLGDRLAGRRLLPGHGFRGRFPSFPAGLPAEYRRRPQGPIRDASLPQTLNFFGIHFFLS